MSISKILRKHKITAKQVSERTGIKYGTMLKYSSGERRPSIRNAKKIADALGIDWWELFEEQEGNDKDASERRFFRGKKLSYQEARKRPQRPNGHLP